MNTQKKRSLIASSLESARQKMVLDALRAQHHDHIADCLEEQMRMGAIRVEYVSINSGTDVGKETQAPVSYTTVRLHIHDFIDPDSEDEEL